MRFRFEKVGTLALLPMCLSYCLLSPINQVKAQPSRAPNPDANVSIDLRYRVENVNQDRFDNDAFASLLRSRVTLDSPTYRYFSAGLEIDNVTRLGPENYNSTENGKTDYPVIADPEYTEANQAWVSFTGDGRSLKAGRQRIQHLQQRFVGSKPWRQNELTYDGGRLQWAASDAFSLDLSYIYNVNQVFGPDDGSNPADLEGDNVFFLANYRSGVHQFSAYAYLLDIDAQAGFDAGKTVNKSSDSYGIQYQGALDRVELRLAYAIQSDAGASELHYDTQYYLLEAKGSVGAFNLKLAYEVLGGNNGVGFATPFAAAHGVQGWADKFLNTPGEGIEDLNMSIASQLGPLDLLAVYHQFGAEASGGDYGTEIDLRAIWRLSEQVKLEAKYAGFSTDSPQRFDDTRKFWFTVQVAFP